MNQTGYVEVSYWEYDDDKKNKKRKDEAENENPENDLVKDEEAERMDWLRAVIDELASGGAIKMLEWLVVEDSFYNA